MAKELPYFKFEPSEWDNGNIQMCNREVKGAFIDLCCLYWSRLGDLKERLAKAKIGPDNFECLLDEDIIRVEEGMVSINFLDSQLNGFEIKSKTASENAKKRWKDTPGRIKGNQVYVIKCKGEGEEFIKIGETSTSINRRFSGKIPYEYEVLIVDTDYNQKLESKYCEIAKGNEYVAKKDFFGRQECFKIDVLNDLIRFAELRNAKYIRSNAIREDKSKEKKSKEERFNFKKALIDYGFKEELVDDWMKVRKTKKASPTKTAFNTFINEVESYKKPFDINELLKHIISNDWKGFKWEWIENSKNNTNGKKQGITSFREKFKAAKEQGAS